MLNKDQKLNKNIFDKDCEMKPIRIGFGEGWNANTWSIPKPERDGVRRGREIFQQKNICDCCL